MGVCSDQAAKCTRPFGCIFVIILSACLISSFRSFAAISPSGGGNSWLRMFGYSVRNSWCFEAGRPQQVARTGWFTLRSVLEYITYVCAYSDGCVQPLVFAQRAIPTRITKGVITLLKEWGKHVWEELGHYRHITLLNIELEILAWILVNCLLVVVRDLSRTTLWMGDQSRIICTWCARI